MPLAKGKVRMGHEEECEVSCTDNFLILLFTKGYVLEDVFIFFAQCGIVHCIYVLGDLSLSV